MIAVGVVGILFVALYNGLIAGLSVVRASNKNLRATQIMLDRMEEMRLYSWQQITSFGSVTSYIPSRFVVPNWKTRLLTSKCRILKSSHSLRIAPKENK